MNDWKFRIGIPAPETADDSKDIETPDGMRRAIERASHDSHVIRQWLLSARIQGLSGEDSYTLLAYHALRLLEDAHQRESHYLERASLRPVRPLQEDPSLG